MADSIIRDDTSLFDETLVQYGNRGRSDEPAPRATMLLSEEFPAYLLVDESEWRDRIHEMEQQQSSLGDVIKRSDWQVKDQKSTNYCWAFAPTAAMEQARVLSGQPWQELSPASVAAPLKNYTNRGGWASEFAQYATTTGVALDSTWDSTAVQPGQQVIKAARSERQHFSLESYYHLPEGASFEERRQVYFSSLLRKIPSAPGYNWWRHQVNGCDLLWVASDNDYGTHGANSWSRSYGDNGWYTIVGKRCVPEDCVFVVTVTPSPGP